MGAVFSEAGRFLSTFDENLTWDFGKSRSSMLCSLGFSALAANIVAVSNNTENKDLFIK